MGVLSLGGSWKPSSRKRSMCCRKLILRLFIGGLIRTSWILSSVADSIPHVSPWETNSPRLIRPLESGWQMRMLWA